MIEVCNLTQQAQSSDVDFTGTYDAQATLAILCSALSAFAASLIVRPSLMALALTGLIGLPLGLEMAHPDKLLLCLASPQRSHELSRKR